MHIEAGLWQRRRFSWRKKGESNTVLIVWECYSCFQVSSSRRNKKQGTYASTTSSTQRNLERTPREGCSHHFFLQPTSGYPTCSLHVSTPKPLDAKEFKSFWWKLRLLYIPWEVQEAETVILLQACQLYIQPNLFLHSSFMQLENISIRFGIHSRFLSFEMK